MRQIQTNFRKATTSKKEPLAEGIRKIRPKGFFPKMNDDELVSYAQKVIDEKRVKSRSCLRREDGGLYYTLEKRKILYKPVFEEGNRTWKHIGDEKVLELARKIIDEKGVKTRTALQNEDSGLYTILTERKLLDRLDIEKIKRPNGFFTKISDDELVSFFFTSNSNSSNNFLVLKI